MQEIPIENLSDPRLDAYRDLPKNTKTRNSEFFIVESEHVVRRALASSFETISVLCCAKSLERVRPSLRPGLQILVAPTPLIRELVGFRFHRGVLACLRRPVLKEPDLHAGRCGQDRLLWVVCSNIVDQENLGALLRSCRAFGVQGVVLANGSADPFARRVLRVSMGAALQLPIWKVQDLKACLRHWRIEQNIKVYATVADPDAPSIKNFVPEKRTALVFGNEGFGLEADILEACDQALTIPIHEKADSLNVATAAGIFLFSFSACGQAATSRGQPH